MGFPIRRSLDQSSFAAPQGLSQRTTSFIASQRQGIHRMLFRHLIAPVIDVRRPPAAASGCRSTRTRSQKDQRSNRFQPDRRMLAEHDLHGSALAAVQATFPLHDVRRSASHTRYSPGSHDPQGRATAANSNVQTDGSTRTLSGWWSRTGSNRRPHACKARALPTELLPQGGGEARGVGAAHDWWAWEDSNFRPHAYQARALTN